MTPLRLASSGPRRRTVIRTCGEQNWGGHFRMNARPTKSVLDHQLIRTKRLVHAGVDRDAIVTIAKFHINHAANPIADLMDRAIAEGNVEHAGMGGAAEARLSA